MFAHRRRRLRPVVAFLGFLAIYSVTGLASDHADGSWQLAQVGRLDANILNFFAFNGLSDPSTLVLVLMLDDNEDVANRTRLPEQYSFAEDLTVELHIDNHSEVSFDFPSMAQFGGRVMAPDKINEDVVFKMKFERTSDGRTAPKLVLEGLPSWAADEIRMFPAQGESPLRHLTVTNEAAIVLELPLAFVVNTQPTLLLWATTNVPQVPGLYADHVGLPVTSSRPVNWIINSLRPRHQWEYLRSPLSEFPRADVMILDTSKVSLSPNGRPIPASARSNFFPYLLPPLPPL